MRAIVFGLLWAIVLPISTVAKESAKNPPKPPLHDRASVTCRLNYPDELKAAHEIEGAAIYPIEGADVAKFLAIFNAAEPVTDFKADRAIVVSTPMFAYVELFEDGCVSHSGKISPSDFDRMMNAAFGGESPDAMAM